MVRHPSSCATGGHTTHDVLRRHDQPGRAADLAHHAASDGLLQKRVHKDPLLIKTPSPLLLGEAEVCKELDGKYLELSRGASTDTISCVAFSICIMLITIL